LVTVNEYVPLTLPLGTVQVMVSVDEFVTFTWIAVITPEGLTDADAPVMKPEPVTVKDRVPFFATLAGLPLVGVAMVGVD
jgi:hypothetical protein